MTPTDGPAAQSEQPERSVRPEPTSAAHSERPEAASPPGSVAEEAALLVDLLSRRSWAGSSGMPPAASHKEDGSAAPLGHDSRHESEHDGSRSSQQRSGTSTGECTCGGSTPAACRVCPVCQLVAFVQQVNPDTIEKVADFVGFAATALRDLAATQRERRAEPHPDAARDAARDAASESEPGPVSEPAPETTASTTPASATASTSDRTRPGERS
ncbi:hypothetical protein [Terrabacter carboxydivorans]|uniref:Uncharacterized protein n=1 Tax=Terrabacter carboxydivorans TaxID=619730 RepID=A0ABN3LZH5_9MICO